MSDNRLVALFQKLEHMFAGVVIESPHADGRYDSNLAAVLTRQLRDVFKDVFASDEIDNLPVEAPSTYIFKTDHRSGPGTHWVDVYTTETGTTTYFDSNDGLPEIPSFDNFLAKRTCKQR